MRVLKHTNIIYLFFILKVRKYQIKSHMIVYYNHIDDIATGIIIYNLFFIHAVIYILRILKFNIMPHTAVSPVLFHHCRLYNLFFITSDNYILCSPYIWHVLVIISYEFKHLR